MKILLAFLAVASSPGFAAGSYLGTNAADIQAGLAQLARKELDEERKNAKHTNSYVPDVGDDDAVVPPLTIEQELETMLKAKTSESPPVPQELVEPVGEFGMPSPYLSQPLPWLQPNSGDEWIVTSDRPLPGRKSRPETTVVIPPGSFVLAELLTGVDAPATGAIPMLIRVKRGFIVPNQGYVDLSGCHAIAKATGEPSSGRVKVQTTGISCLNPAGGEVDVPMKSYGAGSDGMFGIPGEVRSHQGQVALASFVNGVVEGSMDLLTLPGQAQTPGALGLGGAGQAASEVTRWYLEQAKGLVPTVAVGGGAPVRLVLLEGLTLPKSFFKSFPSSKEEGDDYGPIDLVF